jgi:hypothetical protein
MPRVALVASVKVEMFFDDHFPPHVHVSYNEYEEVIDIRSLNTYAGYIPEKKRKAVVKWMAAHQEYLFKKWEEFNE